MLVAIVRRHDDRVLSFFEGSARACARRENTDVYVFRDFPSMIDRSRK